MRIKYSPCKSDHNTSIEIISEDTLQIDDEVFDFDTDSIQFPKIAEQTEGIILSAYRDEMNELWVVVRRFYTDNCEWDTGDYHENNR